MECSYPSEPVSVVCFPQWHNADPVRKQNRMFTTTEYLGHMHSSRNEKMVKVSLFPEFSKLPFYTSLDMSYTSTKTFPVHMCGRHGRPLQLNQNLLVRLQYFSRAGHRAN